MKTFEEKFTAWVDGELKGGELADFQEELAGIKGADIERIAACQMGDLLREHGRAPELRNADFFNHQLMQRIQTGNPKPQSVADHRQYFWSLPGLVLAGAFSLLVAFGLFHFMIPSGTPDNAAQGGDLAQVVRAHSGDPDITASAFRSQRNDVTVLWLEGLKYMPDKRPQSQKTSGTSKNN
jgi:hypothetical protein